MPAPRLPSPLLAASALLVIAALGGTLAFRQVTALAGGPSPLPFQSPFSAAPDVARLKNATFEIEGQLITLSDGVSETAVAPGSASRVVTRYVGHEATGDLNGDGFADVALVLTQTRGGSGAFYYAAAALGSPNGYLGTTAVLLGDRIAPRSTRVQDRAIVVEYADRASGVPFTAPPSVDVSKTLRLVGATLIER